MDVVIGGFGGENLRWLAHVTIWLHCLITTLQINQLEQNTAVYAPITFEEIVIVMIKGFIGML